MAAMTGDPERLVDNFIPGAPAWPLHKPAPDALLVVCPECQFEWDSDHEIELTDGGAVGYECPRCVLTAAMETLAMHQARTEKATDALEGKAVADAELEHLRAQNPFLRAENDAMRDLVRKYGIRPAETVSGATRLVCLTCEESWLLGSDERHARGCLAEAGR